MLYVRSYRKSSDDRVYETRSTRFPNIQSAESDARSRFASDNGIVAVVVAKPDGTGKYGFQKRRDILRFEREGSSIRRRSLV
jgi:hypothetical protein